MKKILATAIALIFLYQLSYGQWTNQVGTGNYYLNSGNISVGTSTPTATVDIVKNSTCLLESDIAFSISSKTLAKPD